MSRLFTSLCLAIGLGLPAIAQTTAPAPIDPGTLRATQTLIDQGVADTVGLQFVEDLTTEIGPRLAGSDAEARARAWAVDELNALGFRNVRIEPFEIPFWSRVIESAEIVSPSPQALTITALGGSTATPEDGVEAEIVRVTSMADLRAADPDDIAGKIVFVDEGMTRTQDGSGYGFAVRKRRNCAAVTAEKGGLVCLIRSVGTQQRRFPHTGMMARGEAVGAGPAAALSPPDADQLNRLLDRGPVTVRVNLQVETQEKVPSGNVVAEVPGRGALADEIVLIGCHLDSWDLGTGAIDDGAGCGIVVGAAKLIADMPGRTKRTIRVVLYGAEEVGLLGANAYARAHVDELNKHVFASESDFGAGKIWRFQTRFGDGALPYAAAMQNVLAPLGVVPAGNDARGGPDIGVLARAGVPVVTPGQDGTDYFDLHHTPDDTFDKIDPASFRQNVAAYAAFIWLAADTGWNFRRPAPDEDPIGTE
ncbi:MAG: M28 family peptidase [Pseudomonadota bacterium]